MTDDDPLDGPDARAWRLARREALASPDFTARVLAAARPAPRPALAPPRWLRWAALTAGGAWFVARLAGLFLVFAAS